MDRDEDVNEETLANQYGDDQYDETPQKRKRGRPKGSTKTTNKKPKAELSEGEIKLKMGRAWYAVNDQKREFRYFTGLQEGEVPCSKKEEKEVKRRLNGYTRLLSNGRSKIAIFEDVDKDQQDQELQQDHQQNFEQNSNNNNGYQQEYQQQEYYTGEGEYQNQDYQNQQQQHMYQQHMYQTNNEGEYNPYQQTEYHTTNDGNVYTDHNNVVYHNVGNQQEMYQNGMYNQVHTGDYSHYNQQDVYQQVPQQQDNNYQQKQEKPNNNEEDDDEEYQPENDNADYEN